MNNTGGGKALPIKATQPAREENIEALVAFFKSGAKGACGELGIELEHIIIDEKTCDPVSYGEEHGVKWLLTELSCDYPQLSSDADGDLLGVSREGEAITLEPAAQIELSAGPFKSLADAQEVFEAFEDDLARRLSSVGKKAVLLGYHPTAKAKELALIPKRRYKFMDLYLGNLSDWGPRMMRGTASTQISIDYASETDCLRKLRIAFALVPIISLICDNTPIFEKERRPHPLMRTEVWKHCDPDRCELVPGVMDEGFSLRDYAEYILDAPAILTPCKQREWCYSEKTFGELYAKTPMKESDVIHAISMFFNDVRLKTYIEIRPADAMPLPYVLSYAALIKGLFSCEMIVDEVAALFADVSAQDIDQAKEALMREGYDAHVYGRPVAEWADQLMDIARRGLADDEQGYLEPLQGLVAQRKTLADLFLEDDCLDG